MNCTCGTTKVGLRYPDVGVNVDTLSARCHPTTAKKMGWVAMYNRNVDPKAQVGRAGIVVNA